MKHLDTASEAISATPESPPRSIHAINSTSSRSYETRSGGFRLEAPSVPRIASAPPGYMRDLRGLSGGERTYTTVCFIISLWYIDEPLLSLSNLTANYYMRK